MDRQQMIRQLLELTEQEQAAFYAHANGIRTREALLARAEHVRPIFSAEAGYRKFVEAFENRISHMLANMNFPRGQRMGLFVHPRFSNNPMHSHDYFEVKYALHGAARLIACGQTFPLEAGRLFVIAPNCPHQTLVFDRDALIINCEFHPDAARELFPRLFQTSNVLSAFLQAHTPAAEGRVLCFPEVPDAVGERMVSALYAEKDAARSPFALSLCESYIEQVFLLLLDTRPEEMRMDISQSKMEDILAILSYIGDHLSDIRFSDLAQAFHYNESYLSGTIKKYTGHSFQDIVRAYRLDEAARLLTATDESIEGIMRQVGYSGKTHFYRSFHDRFGQTPSEYRAGAR